MEELDVMEPKVFVPAKNYELSKAFYQDLGFTMASDEDGIAYFHRGDQSFLLQNFYKKDHADHCTMHLLVKNVESWYRHILSSGLVETYQVHITAPEDKPWGMRDFVLYDPSGVLWRIGQSL